MEDIKKINDYHKSAMGMIFDSILNKEELAEADQADCHASPDDGCEHCALIGKEI